MTERMRIRYFQDCEHPYRSFEKRIVSLIQPQYVVVDAGCGRYGETIRSISQYARIAIGLDLSAFSSDLVNSPVRLLRNDLTNIALADKSVDLVFSRSVFEHLRDPGRVYREIGRILKPTGLLVFLTSNIWDYASVLARIIPNRYHAAILAATEGRPDEDTFPTFYGSNSYRSILRLAKDAGLELMSFDYLSQYPNYFMFSPVLFYLGMLYTKATERIRLLKFLRGWLLVTLRRCPDYYSYSIHLPQASL
jgi:SAM-dependent methyltransferase